MFIDGKLGDPPTESCARNTIPLLEMSKSCAEPPSGRVSGLKRLLPLSAFVHFEGLVA